MSTDGSVSPWHLDEKLFNVKYSSGSSERLAVVKRVFELLVMKRMVDPSDWSQDDQELLDDVLRVFQW